MRRIQRAPGAAAWLLLSALCLAPAALAQDEAAAEDAEEPPARSGATRTRCEGGYPCIHPEAVCCPDLGMCCPSGMQCPASAEDECVYTEPEESGVPR
jgi:hypothetical protein